MAGRSDNRTSLIVAIVLIFVGAWLLIQSPFYFGWGRHPFLGFFSLTGMLNLLLACWVGVDASRREMSGVLWGVLVFFTSIVGLVVYLIVVQSPQLRNGSFMAGGTADTTAATPGKRWCGSCGGQIQNEYRHCPFCGQSAADACPGCAQPVSPEWKVCPHCAAPLGLTGGTPPAGSTPPSV